MKFFLSILGAIKGSNKGNFTFKKLDFLLLFANNLIFISLIISLSTKVVSFFSNKLLVSETFYMELVQIILITLTASLFYLQAKSNNKPKLICISRAVFLCNLIYVFVLFFSFDLISNIDIDYITQLIVFTILVLTIFNIFFIAIISHIKTKK